MILNITLGSIIIVLIIIIIIQRKQKSTLNDLYNTLQKDYSGWENEYLFLKDEVRRCTYQIQLYEKEFEEVPFVIKNGKQLKKDKRYNNKRVIVGDYTSQADNTMKVLQSFGLIVDVVKSGNDIVDRIKNGFKYDLIFTNNQYEKGVTGPNTLDKLKQIKGFKTPVIIHTVDFNKRETYIKEYGFDEYIEKPLNTEKVKPILNKFLNKGKKK